MTVRLCVTACYPSPDVPGTHTVHARSLLPPPPPPGSPPMAPPPPHAVTLFVPSAEASSWTPSSWVDVSIVAAPPPPQP